MNDRPLVIGKGTKQRRDKYTWRYRHSLGKDPVTGKYRYSPWQTIHTTKSREVDAALEAYKAELNSGTYVQKSRDTVGSYAKKFHDNREGTITPLAYSTSYSIENGRAHHMRDAHARHRHEKGRSPRDDVVQCLRREQKHPH